MKKRTAFLLFILLLIPVLCLCACTAEPPSVIGTEYDAEGNLILQMSDGTTVNAGRYEPPANADDNPQGLDFYLQADGTYAVGAGNALLQNEIIVPDTYKGKAITAIISDGFSGCKATKIQLPDSITTIGKSAFSSSHLASIVLPKSLTVIGDRAFENSKLISITIPAGVTKIESYTFSSCETLIEIENLSKINFETDYGDLTNVLNIYTPYLGEKKTFTTDDGYVFYADGSHRYLMGYVGKETELTLPADCNGQTYTVYPYAFANKQAITRVICPEGITAIGTNAFYGCTALESVRLPETLTKIGGSAFAGCKNLAELNIPAAVSSFDSSIVSWGSKVFQSENGIFYIDKWAIDSNAINVGPLRSDTIGIAAQAIIGWDSTSLILPDTLLWIDEGGIQNCRDLVEIVIPVSVKYIGSSTLRGCNALTAIYYGGSKENAALFDQASVPENATLYFYSEEQPTTEGNYWHYVNDIPTPW